MYHLNHKTAVITGAGSGIGRALAQQLAERGCNLALSDVNEAALAETVELLPEHVRVTSHQLDVADKAAVYGYTETVIKDHGAVDLVINNAGVGLAGSVEALHYQDFEWIVGINFWGVVYCTKAFLPHLKMRPHGHIVNISSVLGIVGTANQSAYNATKFAVRGFTEASQQEMVDTSISVTCVYPGGIKTNIAKAARIAAGKDFSAEEFEKNFITTPEQAASRIISAICKGKKRLLIGRDAVAVDLVQRLLPTHYDNITSRMIKQ